MIKPPEAGQIKIRAVRNEYKFRGFFAKDKNLHFFLKFFDLFPITGL